MWVLGPQGRQGSPPLASFVSSNTGTDNSKLATREAKAGIVSILHCLAMRAALTDYL